MSSDAKRLPLDEQEQHVVEFQSPHNFRGELYEAGDTVVTGHNAAKKLAAAGHKTKPAPKSMQEG